MCSYIHNINMKLQWNPSITDTSENQHFVPCSEVSLTQASGIFLVCIIGLRGYLFRAFPCCTLAGKISRGYITVLILCQVARAVMVGNLAEKVNECPLNWGR